MRALGYPKGSETLVTRMDGLAPGWRRHRGPGLRKGDASLEGKAWAVAELGARPGTAAEVADRHGVARDMPHRWRGAMLGDGCGDVETRGVMPF
ncbi:hypothetical protein [Olsenella sp. Marseille-P4559]|uniref:hypothetical protein n=1 Tax=Olsenella sp. Marseille-P4559 TaxID=2364795 RepID=UPI00103270B6|nr:hypothetical protein [Olsenella sp. Marseille-P4559]